MIEEIKILLGEAAGNYTEAQIELAYRMAAAEVEDYCKRELDTVLEFQAMKIAVISLNRTGTEGLGAQGYSGISESFINDLPEDIKRVLNRKRKLKVV